MTDKPRGATFQDGRTFMQKIREAGMKSSPKTEDSNDSLESEKYSRNSVLSKLPPYKGGTRATKWLKVILKKFSQSVESEFQKVKSGELNP